MKHMIINALLLLTVACGAMSSNDSNLSENKKDSFAAVNNGYLAIVKTNKPLALRAMEHSLTQLSATSRNFMQEPGAFCDETGADRSNCCYYLGYLSNAVDRLLLFEKATGAKSLDDSIAAMKDATTDAVAYCSAKEKISFKKLSEHLADVSRAFESAKSEVHVILHEK